MRLWAPTLYFQEKNKTTAQHRIGENRCLRCFTLPCLINIGRSSWEHLFRVSPHPSGQGLTTALTICCISHASFWCYTFPQNFPFSNKVNVQKQTSHYNVMQTLEMKLLVQITAGQWRKAPDISKTSSGRPVKRSLMISRLQVTIKPASSVAILRRLVTVHQMKDSKTGKWSFRFYRLSECQVLHRLLCVGWSLSYPRSLSLSHSQTINAH